MSILKEFKDFALKGNLVDLAVGFVMGAAFTKVTSSFIQGMVMPLVGMIQGKDLTDWKFVLKQAELDESGKEIAAEVALTYGTFLTVTIEFIMVALVMFLVIKAMNSAKKKKEETPVAPATPTKEELLLTEIRDLLKNK